MPSRRLCAAALALVLASPTLIGGSCADLPLNPVPGLAEYRALGRVAVPGGWVDVAGGNLHLARLDLSLDTKLGPYALAACYDSSAGAWRFGFEMAYDGERFSGPDGAVHTTAGLVPGEAIAGTHWVYEGPGALRTKGGLRHEFSAGGLERIRWQGAAYPQLRFPRDAAGQLLRIEQCTAAGECLVLFDLQWAGGRLAGVSDHAGRATRYGYDGQGRLTRAEDGLDVERGLPGTRYTWSGSHITALTRSDGERIEYEYDDGRLVSARAVGEESPRWRFHYRGRGADALFETEAITPSGARTTHFYDGQGRQRQRRDEQTGDEIHWEWVGRRPSRQVDAAGAATSFLHANDDLYALVTPAGNVLVVETEPGARNPDDPLATPIRELRDSLGVIERRGYDAAGRLAWLENGAAERTSFSHDALGQLAAVTRPDGVTVRFEGYGDHGHPKRRVVADVTVSFGYDAVGNLTRGPGGGGPASPAIGGIQRRVFDAGRRVVEVTLTDLEGGAVTSTRSVQIERRADGLPLAIRRPHGGDWEYRYDALGRVIERRERADGSWHATRFEYDGAGRPSARELANGMRVEWEYDASDRLRVTRQLGTGTPAEAVDDYALGRLVSRLDSSAGAPEQYLYDAAGRLAEIRYPGGEREEREHDLRGRLAARRLWREDGGLLTEITRRYDAAGRPAELYERGVRVLEHRYAAGLLDAVSYGNGLTRTLGYHGQLGYANAWTTRDPGGSKLEESSLAWDLTLFRADASTRTWGGVVATKAEQFFLGPLFGEAGAGPRVWLSHANELDYDALSNLRRIGDAEFSYNAEKNRLEGIQGGGRSHGYAYDAAGYATWRDGAQLAWDAAGRIRRVGVDATFDWDVAGRPLARRLGAEVSVYRFGGAVRGDAYGEPVALDLGEVLVRFDSGERFYRHLDFRGNVRFVSDDAGVVRAHYRYGAYGVQWVGGGSEVEGEFAQGRPATDGLLVLGSRLYEPDAGRFLSPDPVPQLVNQYAYAMGNPVQAWDPTGREFTAKGGFFTAAGAGGYVAGKAIASGIVVSAGLGGAAAFVVVSTGVALGIAGSLIVANHVYQGVTGERGIDWETVAKAMAGWVTPPDFSRSENPGRQRGGPPGFDGPSPGESSGPQAKQIDLSVLEALNPTACTAGHSFSGGMVIEILSPFGPLRVVNPGGLFALLLPALLLVASKGLFRRRA